MGDQVTDTRTDWSEDAEAEGGKKRGLRGKIKAPKGTGEKADRKAEKAERGKAEKPSRAERASRKREKESRETVKTSAIVSMVTAPEPSREELARQAAIEFGQAVAPSMDLLKAAVPEASSPEEAWRIIEGRLGKPIKDPDAQLPDHPIYSGDTLVYHQLRRHYGRPHDGGSFQRGWQPGGSGGMPPILGA